MLGSFLLILYRWTLYTKKVSECTRVKKDPRFLEGPILDWYMCELFYDFVFFLQGIKGTTDIGGGKYPYANYAKGQECAEGK